MARPKFNRILLKISGEALMGDQSFGISPGMIKYVAEEVRSVFDLGVQTAIVVGTMIGTGIFLKLPWLSFHAPDVRCSRLGPIIHTKRKSVPESPK